MIFHFFKKLDAKRHTREEIDRETFYRNRLQKTLFVAVGIIGAFCVNAVCFYLYFQNKVPLLLLLDALNIYVTLFFILGIFILPYHPLHYGLNLNNPRENLFIGLGLGLPAVLAIILLRVLLYRQGLTGFGFNPAIKVSYFIYPLFVLAQEVVVKGYLQSFFVMLLERHRPGKAIAIGIASLVFAQFHLLLGWPVFLFTWLYGVVTGWLYERSRSVLGIALLHFFAGFTLLNFTNFYR